MTSEHQAHDCPVNGCNIPLPWGFLMCRPHWRSLPCEIRYDVTWAWNKGKPVGVYRSIRDNAIRIANEVAG